MDRLKRLWTAFSRYRSGKGFGVHSPFAFNFILKVLEERCPYYAYPDIEEKRKTAEELCPQGVLTRKEARLVFRVVNHFNPEKILQAGSGCGVSAVSALSVSAHSTMWLCNPSGDATAYHLLKEYSDRINFYKSAKACFNDYQADKPFVVVNSVCDDEYPLVSAFIKRTVQRDCVIIICNIVREPSSRRLWKETVNAMTAGMSFTNGKIGVIVGHGKLPLMHYSFWL